MGGSVYGRDLGGPTDRALVYSSFQENGHIKELFWCCLIFLKITRKGQNRYKTVLRRFSSSEEGHKWQPING